MVSHHGALFISMSMAKCMCHQSTSIGEFSRKSTRCPQGARTRSVVTLTPATCGRVLVRMDLKAALDSELSTGRTGTRTEDGLGGSDPRQTPLPHTSPYMGILERPRQLQSSVYRIVHRVEFVMCTLEVTLKGRRTRVVEQISCLRHSWRTLYQILSTSRID